MMNSESEAAETPAKPFSLLDCSVRVEKCEINGILNAVQKNCQVGENNSDGRTSQTSSVGKEFDASYEDDVKSKKRVSFSDQILVYELKNEYKCHKCPETFNKPSKLRHHIQRTHKLKQYICYYCMIQYSRRDLFKAHIKLHCDICKRLLSSRQEYMEHRETVCGITNKFTCYICRINYFTEIDLQNHLAHHLVLPYNCERCKKHFLSKCSLTHHIYNNHTNKHFEDVNITQVSDTVIYRCQHCEQSSAYREEIEKHLEIHPGSNENIENNAFVYKCDLCDSKFNLEQDLVKHKWSHYMDSQNDKQTSEQTTESVESDFSTKTVQNLKIDLKNGIPDFVPIHFNPKVVLEKLDLSILNNRDVIYNSSPQEVNSQNLLMEIDKKKIHDNNESSNHSASRKSSLTNKITSDYQCKICLSCYISSYNLKRHMSTVHNKECIYCRKKFITGQSLKDHKCTKILDVPMADERSVVHREDLKKTPSLSDICTISSKSDEDNNLLIVEVKSLNPSYNVIQTIEHIRVNKFNVKNRTPKCFSPRVLVERMDFSKILKKYNTNDVIDLDNDDDDCIIVPNLVQSILKDFDTQKDDNKSKPKDSNQKSLIGKIRVIQNTTKNFIDAEDPKPINPKPINHIKILNPNAHNNSVKSFCSKQIENLNMFNDHDVTDDIPVNILQRPPVISVNSTVMSNIGPKETPSGIAMPPRILNNELSNVPSIVNPDTRRQSNPLLTMEEISHLEPGSIVMGNPGLEGARVGAGYLMRLPETNHQNQHTPRIIRPVIYLDELQNQNGQPATLNNSDPNNTGPSPLLNSMLSVNRLPPWLQSANEPVLSPPNIQQNQMPINNNFSMNMGSNASPVLDMQAQDPMLNSEPVLNRTGLMVNNVQSGSSRTQENVRSYPAHPNNQSKKSNSDPKEYICKVCNKYYAVKGALTSHLRKKHHLAHDYSVLIDICPLCNEAFTSSATLQRHTIKCHVGQKSKDATSENYQNHSPGIGQHQSFVYQTDNNSPHHLGNANVVGNTDTQQLTMDIEIPMSQNRTSNLSAPAPARNTNTYEYNNYKVILTEVPIEF